MVSSDSPDISIVIVHYRTEDVLRRCLQHLAAAVSYSGLDCKAVVVNNSPRSEPLNRLEQASLGIRWIHNKKNEGFATAINQGLAHAQGRYCLLLNPDCLVSPTTLKTLHNRMEEDLRVGIGSGRHRFGNGQLQRTCREFPTLWNVFTEQSLLSKLFSKSRLWNRYKLANWQHDREREVDQLMGSCLMIRRKVLEQIGTLDERFFLYFEEVDFCLRAKRDGWKIVFFPEPGAEVVHIGGASSSQDLPMRTLQRAESLCLWFRKHRPGAPAMLVKGMLLVGLVFRVIAFGFRCDGPRCRAHLLALARWPWI